MADPSKLNDRCYIQIAARVSDGAGGWLPNEYVDGSALWCMVYQTGMQERAYANQVGVSAQWTIRTRYDAVTRTLRQGDRLRFGSHILRVTSVQNMQGRNDEIKMLAEEITPAQVNR